MNPIIVISLEQKKLFEFPLEMHHQIIYDNIYQE